MWRSKVATCGLLIWCLLNFAACAPKPIKTVEVVATANCSGPDCIGVSRRFIEEHFELFAETIRLKASLSSCQEGHQ